MDNLFDAFQFFRLYFGGFVQQDNVTKFDLLDDKIFDVFFVNILTSQFLATGEFALQPKSIYHSNDTV